MGWRGRVVLVLNLIFSTICPYKSEVVPGVLHVVIDVHTKSRSSSPGPGVLNLN
eukprot:SAG31_NODE_1488_length_8104_cov_6.771585_7_plen_54_part_00